MGFWHFGTLILFLSKLFDIGRYFQLQMLVKLVDILFRYEDCLIKKALAFEGNVKIFCYGRTLWTDILYFPKERLLAPPFSVKRPYTSFLMFIYHLPWDFQTIFRSKKMFSDRDLITKTANEVVYRLPPPPPKKKYNRHLGIVCKRTLYGIRKIKADYENMTISLQFSENPIWFGPVVTKKYGFL